MHDKLSKDRDDLSNEVERKLRLARQAIAARENMKSHLDQEKKLKEDAFKN